MDYFALRPEVAGGIGPGTVMDVSTHPPLVSQLNYEFVDWLGDDLLETYPCYVVTERLAQRLREAAFDGVQFADVEVTVGPEGEDFFPEGPPKVLWLRVAGVAVRDDVGLTDRARLVLSKRALEVFQEFNLNNCDIEISE